MAASAEYQTQLVTQSLWPFQLDALSTRQEMLGAELSDAFVDAVEAVRGPNKPTWDNLSRLAWAYVEEFSRMVCLTSETVLLWVPGEPLAALEVMRFRKWLSSLFGVTPPEHLLEVYTQHDGLVGARAQRPPLLPVREVMVRERLPIDERLLLLSENTRGDGAVMLMDDGSEYHGWIFAYWHEDYEGPESLVPLARSVPEYLISGWSVAECLMEGCYLGPSPGGNTAF